MKLSEMVDIAFAPGGPVDAEMKRLGRNYAPNTEQIAYARAVAASFDEAKEGVGEVSLLEAETGVGKSLGYLVPMALHCARCHTRGLVSTYTLNLQAQLMSKDAPIALAVAKEMTGKSLTAAIRKGMGNYLSPSRIVSIMAAMTADGVLSKEARTSLDALRAFAVSNGDIAEWKELHGPIPCGLSEADVCLTAACRESDKERHAEHVQSSHEADIVITNHAMTVISALRWNRVLAGKHGFDVGVIDEADRLPDAAASVFNSRISAPMLHRALDAIEPFCPVLTMEYVNSAIHAWQDWMDTTFNAVQHKPSFKAEDNGGYVLLAGSNLSVTRAQAVEHAERMAKQILIACNGVVERGADQEVVQEIQSYAAELNEFVRSASSAEAEEGNSQLMTPLLRWSPVRAFPSLSVVPIYPGRLAARLFRPGKIDGKETPPFLRSLVFTSATLDAPVRHAEEGDADFLSFRTEIGLFHSKDKPKESRHLSPDRCHRLQPRDFGRWDGMFLADRAAPHPTLAVADGEEAVKTNPAWLEYAAQGVLAAHQGGGRSLVLTNSFNDTASLAELLRAHGIGVIEQKRGKKLVDCLSAYADDPNAVLITPGGWEGLDLPGLIDNLIITRLPFASIDHAKFGAREAAMARRGMSADAIKAINYGTTINATKRKLRQGFGRLIRNKNDHGTIWILDPRFPLPQTITSNRRARAYNDASFVHFSDCIPERFRSGFDDVYSSAKVFEYAQKTQEVA